MELESLLSTLATKRPVFHSEADFQHALAWELHQHDPTLTLRLEKPITAAGKPGAVDILVVTTGGVVAIELKYWKKKLAANVNGESYQLKNQAAQDISRYDFWKDVSRLERLIEEDAIRTGFVVALTNDPGYWRSGRSGTVDESFRMHEGRVVNGPLRWSDRASAGTKRNRESEIVIRNAYTLEWKAYSTVPARGAGVFRYVLVESVSR